jgi:hypothetical protein
MRPIPGEDLIHLDHDLIGTVDPLYPRRTRTRPNHYVMPPQNGAGGNPVTANATNKRSSYGTDRNSGAADRNGL